MAASVSNHLANRLNAFQERDSTGMLSSADSSHLIALCEDILFELRKKETEAAEYREAMRNALYSIAKK